MAKQTQPEIFPLRADPMMPNNPRLPVLVYRGALSGTVLADRFEKAFERNGWGGLWRDGIYNYHHFHSTSHEALGIATGAVTVMLGGKSGITLRLKAGDLLVLPAGTGHCSLASAKNLVVVGAYPAGQEDYDICRSLKKCPGAKAHIEKVPLPEADPLYGRGGPLTKIWRK
ncbi:MAG TPA: cupin [Patescibacteria group bacterium]|nr:cupin [Patescibacteria group bacterium]